MKILYGKQKKKDKTKNKVPVTTISAHTFNYHFLQLVITASKQVWKNKNRFNLHMMYIISKCIFYTEQSYLFICHLISDEGCKEVEGKE